VAGVSPSATTYDHIVVGVGALGSATAYRLARAGAGRVLAIEQFALGHGRGGSDDHSRIIRHAYHSAVYTALTHEMFRAWRDVEDESGLQLVTTTGGLDLARLGTPGELELHNYGATLPADVEREHLDADEVRRRWPQWSIDDDTVAMYQPDGGLLDIRRANGAHRALARAHGVELLSDTKVLALHHHSTHVEVVTSAGTFEAGSVVLCTASWAADLLAPLGYDWRFTISQEQVSWFATPNVRDFLPDRFPMWIWHDEPLFYGFPIYGEVAVKVSRDVSGRWVTADTRSFDPEPSETEMFADFLRRRVPGALGPELFSRTCIYDMTPDRDFVLDRLPGHPRITVGFGAAHAAKFAALIGEILAEVALEGASRHPIGSFRADRPALNDPTFEPAVRMKE
jgi:sarcosine oxidase